MEAIIEAHDLKFGYGGELVLRGTGLTVQAGDFAGIIGSNGAGKSTLMGLLLGELSPLAGSVRLFSQPVERFRDWRRLGYVPQNSATLAGFPASVQEVVASSLYGHGQQRLPGRERQRRALLALERVGMRDRATSMIGGLSGGQLQRVMLARALVGEPELLLLDEPAAGVDARFSEQMYQLLQSLNKAGITVVMITHDLHRAAQYLHRAFCLEQGSIVELDQDQLAHELEHRHQHP